MFSSIPNAQPAFSNQIYRSQVELLKSQPSSLSVTMTQSRKLMLILHCVEITELHKRACVMPGNVFCPGYPIKVSFVFTIRNIPTRNTLPSAPATTTQCLSQSGSKMKLRVTQKTKISSWTFDSSFEGSCRLYTRALERFLVF